MRVVQRLSDVPAELPVTAVFEAAWHMALIPLVAKLAFKRDNDWQEWLIAYAFSMSWFVDLAAHLQAGSWATVSYLPALQLSFFGVAVGAGLWLPVVMVAVSFIGDPVLTTFIGSAFVILHSTDDRARAVVLLYCGFGSALFMGLVATRPDPAVFMALWWPYQACRAAAMLLYLRLLIPRKKAVLA